MRPARLTQDWKTMRLTAKRYALTASLVLGLGVAEVADHLLGRPRLQRRAPPEHRLGLPRDGRREVVRGAGHPGQPLVERQLGEVLERGNWLDVLLS